MNKPPNMASTMEERGKGDSTTFVKIRGMSKPSMLRIVMGRLWEEV